MRRLPLTTRNSGVTFVASAAHAEPLRRTASSEMVGVPPLIVNRRRSSWFLSPSQVTVSASPATLAVMPGAAL